MPELREQCLVQSCFFITHTDIKQLRHIVEIGNGVQLSLHVRYDRGSLLDIIQVLDEGVHISRSIQELVCYGLQQSEVE